MVNTTIPQEQRVALARLVPDLLQKLPEKQPAVIAVCGAPGTGKSTLANACLAELSSIGVTGIIVSLDDYYLPQAARQRLSETEHPLLSVRGVPGTHDLDLLTEHITALLDSKHGRIEMPQFDKSLDDRLEQVTVIDAGATPAYVFLEGWIAGVPPQSSAQLLAPVNDLESEHDMDGQWRSYVNACLHDYQQALDSLIDARWYLQAPDWESVIQWRLQQEQSAPKALARNRENILQFLKHFQRLYLHMQDGYTSWADIIVELDVNHIGKTGDLS